MFAGFFKVFTTDDGSIFAVTFKSKLSTHCIVERRIGLINDPVLFEDRKTK